jgi:hypothetical protein
MKSEGPAADQDTAEHSLSFDPSDPLVRDPRFLVDDSFLNIFRSELEERLGLESTAQVLFQLGFYHGLRDASAASRNQNTHSHTAPLFGLEFHADASNPETGGLRLHGSWPERPSSEDLPQEEDPNRSSCAIHSGYTSGWLSGLFEKDLLAVASDPSDENSSRCNFLVREATEWESTSLPWIEGGADSFPFEKLSDCVQQDHENTHKPEPAYHLSNGTQTIQVWGPVMVLPFAGPDEALRAISMIHQEPGVTNVSVVVLDLCETIIDEAFGAVALECIVEAADQMGVELILTGVSLLSEHVLTDLESCPLIYKEMHSAIGAAFQIAKLQQQLT